MSLQQCSLPSDVVYLPVAEWRQALPQLRFGCVERVQETPDGRISGFMSLADDIDTPRLWLGWHWTEFTPGAVAQADAQALHTSIRLVGDNGRPLRVVEQFQELQTAMFLLAWWQHIDLNKFRHVTTTSVRFELPSARLASATYYFSK